MSDKKRAKLVVSRQAAGRPGSGQARSSSLASAGRGADEAPSAPIVEPLGRGSPSTSVATFSRPHDGDAAAGEREKSDPIAAAASGSPKSSVWVLVALMCGFV